MGPRFRGFMSSSWEGHEGKPAEEIRLVSGCNPYVQFAPFRSFCIGLPKLGSRTWIGPFAGMADWTQEHRSESERLGALRTRARASRSPVNLRWLLSALWMSSQFSARSSGATSLTLPSATDSMCERTLGV